MPDQQNGSPDCAALIDDGGSVVKFRSYEESFTPGDRRVAGGQVSINMAVFEPTDALLGPSLRFEGTGDVAADSTWPSPSDRSRVISIMHGSRL